MREHVVRHAPFSCYYVARMKLNRNIVEGYRLALFLGQKVEAILLIEGYCGLVSIDGYETAAGVLLRGKHTEYHTQQE